MLKSTWIYDLSTGAFLRGGFAEFEYDPQTEGRIELDDPVDIRTQRLDLNTLQPRAATLQEMTDYDTSLYDARATNAFYGNKVLVAAILALYTTVLRRPPTQQEQTDLFNAAKTIYRTL